MWRDSAPDLELTVRCEGGRHRIRWTDGRLVLDQHPELEAELAIVALGGPEPVCVSHYHLWNDALADGGFLGEWVDETRLSPSWFSWLAMALERMRAEGFHEFLRRLPPARALRMGEFLDWFPVPWLDRAAAEVNHAVFEGDGVTCELAPSLLATAVTHRLRRAFVDAVGGRQLSVGAAALVPLQLSVNQPSTGNRPLTGDRALAADPSSTASRTTSSEPACGAVGGLTGPGRGVTVSVDPTWLHRVWAADAAVVDGHLVLALDPDQANDHTALAQLVVWHPDSTVGHRPTVEFRSLRFQSGSWTIIPD